MNKKCAIARALLNVSVRPDVVALCAPESDVALSDFCSDLIGLKHAGDIKTFRAEIMILDNRSFLQIANLKHIAPGLERNRGRIFSTETNHYLSAGDEPGDSSLDSQAHIRPSVDGEQNAWPNKKSPQGHALSKDDLNTIGFFH